MRRTWCLGVLLLVASACDKPAPDDQEDGPCAVASPIHDGVYGLTFHADGQPRALGLVRIADGLFDSSVTGLSHQVDVAGCVFADGTIRFETITATSGSPVTAEGTITGGVIDGAYTVGEEGAAGYTAGVFHGAVDNWTGQDSHREFDGDYAVSFSRGGQERASATITVDNGAFATTVTSTDLGDVNVQGFISSDGTIVVNSLSGGVGALLAEGIIDQDTFDVQGLYTLGGVAGTFTGQGVP